MLASGILDHMGNVAAYVRISHDPGQRRVGVERQRTEIGELAARLGLQVDETYEDNGRSAYNGDDRPQFNRLIADLTAGRIAVLLAWDQDRITRQVGQWESVVHACQMHGVRLVFVTSGELDLSTAAARLTTRIGAAVNRHESEHKSERITAASRERATQGKAHGRIPFGYRREYDVDARGVPIPGQWRDVVDDDAAAVIREATDRVLRGEPLRAICRDFDERGIRSSRGATFETSTLRTVLMRPGNAGLRYYKGEPWADAQAPAIIERAKWERLVRLLKDPKRVTVSDNTVRHLLTGIASCGKCGGPVRAKGNQYQCRDSYCFGRKREPIDELVEEVVIARLSQPDAAQLFAGDDTEATRAAEEAAELRARLDQLVDDYADGILDRAGMARATARIRPQLEAAEARTRAASTAATDLLDGLTGPEVADRWARLPVARRRAVVAMLLTVEIHPVGHGSRTFDPDSVGLSWRT